MPSHTSTADVAAPPGDVFAIIDALERTPQWLGPCTRLENLDGGPTAVGQRLRFHYSLGARAGTMDGSVAERTEGRSLALRFADGLLEAGVAFAVEPGPTDAASRVTLAIRADTKGFKGKLLSPLIGSQLPGQTDDAVASLTRLAEEGGAGS